MLIKSSVAAAGAELGYSISSSSSSSSSSSLGYLHDNSNI